MKDRELSALQKKHGDMQAAVSDLEAKLAAALRDAEHWKQQHQVRPSTVDFLRSSMSAESRWCNNHSVCFVALLSYSIYGMVNFFNKLITFLLLS